MAFWHKVEFFIPFDLRGQVLQAKGAEWSVKYITAAELQAIAPASSGDLWQVARVPEEKAVRGFELYLGVFDKSVLATVTERLIGSLDAEAIRIDQEERGELEGETCFAKVWLNAAGEPQLDQVSVSTVPWALGAISRQGLGGLSFDAFQASLKRLQDDLRNFQARRQSADAASESSQEVLPLTRADIEKLLDVFRDWAGFEPGDTDAAVAVVRAVVGKRTAADSKAAPEEASPGADEDEDEDSSPDEIGIDILNSFYIKDIERTIDSLRQGRTTGALDAYLTPLPPEQRIDLYSPAGHRRIVADLDPGNTPPARWLDEPRHAMSLMQQFAINRIFSCLSDGGLFSVNGPPGTGKTTLLRDIFAENITRRARILASFGSAGEAFQTGRKPRVEFEGSSASWSIAVLKPELTGFEMVVASSNNAAVNNISEDIPKAKSLGSMDWDAPAQTAWREKDGKPRHTYLQTVATRMAAQTGRGDFTELGPDDTPWGLISCALGKRGNRRKFVQRFFFPVIKKDQPKDAPRPKGYDPLRHHSFWEWRDSYRGLGFAAAKAVFIGLDEEVRERQGKLARLSVLAAELAGQTESTYVLEQAQRLANAQAVLEQARARLAEVDRAVGICHERLATLKDIERLIPVPSKWTALFGKIPSTPFWSNPFRQKYQAYLDALHENRAAQRTCLQEKLVLDSRKAAAEPEVAQASATVELARQALDARAAEWRAKSAEHLELQGVFPDAAMPEKAGDIEAPPWQKQGIWYDAGLNALRSRLFAAALTLHEAWLAEVTAKGGGFQPNLYAMRDLLQGMPLTTPEHALALWQSLFMIVPVVSSTFASIASQFKELGAGSLGWLFIDEAGQAVPQAAVGALWRARRAVVVGDPLQIEPVFTVPVKLIEALAQSSALPEDMRVMPHKVSVQNLADAGNACGAWVAGREDEPEWLGSPLRVHRRCADPMFQIANAIAYENKMIFGLDSTVPPANGYDLGASAWVHEPGATLGRHVVPAQVELVAQAVMRLYQSKGKLPPLYIISPFKRIKQALLERLSDIGAWKGQGIGTLSKSDLGKWCNENIGTVHTFQGKEERIVWMVLGCDIEGEGAVSWAAGKPNILNVALTRAKHRFFMIGDALLWGEKRYFQEARRTLPEISGDEFLERMAVRAVDAG
ncbi:hypothetical protein BAU06_15905 [Bordetella bronchialis]|uniref:DNA2/NAM7 helicase-like C-terminal domain-containing protein n=1 Tax=Bordetella bronchialis TaxID=463025 RepID=A0ABM6D156_9BORD|nr:hypothetical protein BAU06_15905 [Bordetella bronchialis]